MIMMMMMVMLMVDNNNDDKDADDENMMIMLMMVKVDTHYVQLTASPNPRILNNGFNPCSLANRPDVTTKAAAPSLSLDELAAVTVPSFLKAGLSVASLSSLMDENSSSAFTTTGAPPRLSGIVTAATSSSNLPEDQAADARL